MKNNNKKTVFITGASSGIGEACLNYFIQKGYNVIGVSRNIEEKEEIINGSFIRCIKMDVTNEESIKKVFDSIKDIDIAVLSAGMGIAGACENMPIELSKLQMEVNFFGVLNVCKYIIPIMRKKKSVMIVAISSIAGIVPIPMQAHYSCSKYSLEAYMEALRIELKDFNIKTCLVEPGDTKTGFTNSRNIYNPIDSPYHDICDASINKMANDEQTGKDPITVAKVVYKVSNRKNPPVRVAVGFEYKILAFLIKILPSKFRDYILFKMYMPKIKK